MFKYNYSVMSLNACMYKYIGGYVLEDIMYLVYILLLIGEYTPQKLRNSHCCVPFTATFSKRRKIGSL